MSRRSSSWVPRLVLTVTAVAAFAVASPGRLGRSPSSRLLKAVQSRPRHTRTTGPNGQASRDRR